MLSNEALKLLKLQRRSNSKHVGCIRRPKAYFLRKRDRLQAQRMMAAHLARSRKTFMIPEELVLSPHCVLRFFFLLPQSLSRRTTVTHQMCMNVCVWTSSHWHLIITVTSCKRTAASSWMTIKMYSSDNNWFTYCHVNNNKIIIIILKNPRKVRITKTKRAKSWRTPKSGCRIFSSFYSLD